MQTYGGRNDDLDEREEVSQSKVKCENWALGVTLDKNNRLRSVSYQVINKIIDQQARKNARLKGYEK